MSRQESHRACIALGSNLGNRRGNLEAALAQIRDAPAIFDLQASTFIETPPVDCPPGSPPFLNAAAVLGTSMPPRRLLDRLLAIEAAMGRQRAGEARNAPRIIDLDLLLYGDRVMDEAGLVLPHPRMHERGFVLTPLAEIAPDFPHPRLRRTVAQLLADFRSAAATPPDRARAGGG